MTLISEKIKEKPKPTIVACIAAYNEEKTVGKLILELEKYVNKIVVVDDGSKDTTRLIASRLGAQVISHERNLGKGAALKTAFNFVKTLKCDIIVTIDGDGQHDPRDIPALIEPLIRGEVDVVIGSRYADGANDEAPLYRKFGLKILNYLSRKATKTSVNDTQSGFRAYTTKALSLLGLQEYNGYSVETEQLKILAANKVRITELPINVKYRGLEKTSKMSPLIHGGQILASTIKLIAQDHPLLYLGFPGLSLIILGLIFGFHLLDLFNASRYFSIPIAIISVGTIVIGLILTLVALILYVVGTDTMVKKTPHDT